MKRIFIVGVIIGLLLLSTSAASGTWWDTDFTYRKEVNISNTGENLTNYQVKVVHNFSNEYLAGKINTTCNDIRFTYYNTTIDSETENPFWLETCNFSTSDNMTAWVNVSFLENNTNTTLYMYYGNVSASSITNITDTFLLGDDFTDNSSIADINKYDVCVGPNYDAFGILINLSETHLMYIYRGNASVHGYDPDGAIMKKESTDGGETWGSESLVYDNEYDNHNPAGGITSNGTIVFFFSNYDHTGDGFFQVNYITSYDNGSTWSEPTNITEWCGPYPSSCNAYGKIVNVPGVGIFQPFYELHEADVLKIIWSYDDGATFSTDNVTTVWESEGNLDEADFEYVGDGKIIGIIRHPTCSANLSQAYSDDNGTTWMINDTGLSICSSPVWLTRYSDNGKNRLMMVYGDRNAPYCMKYTTVAVDDVIADPTVWGTAYQYVFDCASTTTDFGYPRTVHVGGLFKTVYYIDVQPSTDDADSFITFIPKNVHTPWIKSGTPNIDYSDGVLHLDSSTSVNNRLQSHKAFSNPVVLETRSKINFSGENYGQIGFGIFSYPITSKINYAVFTNYDSLSNQSHKGNANGTDRMLTSGSNMESYFVNKIKWKSDEIKYINSNGTTIHTTCIPTTEIPVIIGGIGYSDGPFDMYLDYLFVRKYALSEPVVLFGGEQSSVATPSISNVGSSNIKTNTATITWTVNLSTNNRVFYGKNINLTDGVWSLWSNNTDLVSIGLSGLDLETSYYYQAWSHNPYSHNLSDSEPATEPYESFVTLAGQTTLEKFTDTTKTSIALMGILAIVVLAVLIIGVLLNMQSGAEIDWKLIMIGVVTLIAFMVVMFVALSIFSAFM